MCSLHYHFIVGILMVCLQDGIQIISIYTAVVKLRVKRFRIPHLLMK